MIRYSVPGHWVLYNASALAPELVEAKASVMSLQQMPHQKSWVEGFQEIELKREVAGTSRIEGADFTEQELDEALAKTSEELATRSQRQARAAKDTYQWIARLGDDVPIDGQLICAIHRRIVLGADDDHCAPGVLRTTDQNVNFGQPRHRGASGGVECAQAFAALIDAMSTSFRGHDPLIQALATHYHLAAMHPFSDGNGRTARAVEALMLQRAGLRDYCFISMSNYYYDEKISYLNTLAEVRRLDFDLTPFLKFGLKGIAQQSRRVLKVIETQVAKALYRNMMFDLFGRLQSPKKRVIAERQVGILKLLLSTHEVEIEVLEKRTLESYGGLQNPTRALYRDLNALLTLRAIDFRKGKGDTYHFRIRLEWPSEISESQFFETLRNLPKAKTSLFAD